MAELLFREDAYLRECQAVVTRVDETCVEIRIRSEGKRNKRAVVGFAEDQA